MIRVDEDDLDSEPYGPVLHREKPFTGETEDRLPDGTLVSRTTYVNGLPDGPEKEWYNDGSLRSEGQFQRGVP
ncbi:MAG: hypothetical protein ABS976_26935, partial [Rhodococcus sp. (in: high G+C Gram-positive bacteria)]